VKVRKKATTCFVVGVRNVVAAHRTFTRYLTYSSHFRTCS
jgi:hypothetical protein